MGFLKFSVFLLFLLSLVSAVSSLYLATIRENEKEKRIFLEQVRDDLESQIETLQTEKSALKQEVMTLLSENEGLAQKYEQAEEARMQALDLIREKDMDLDALRGEVSESRKAFEMAQKRNDELERILEELELRMTQMQGGGRQPAPTATYVGLEFGSEGTAPRSELESSELGNPVGGQSVLPEVMPETVAPKRPKKRHGFFSFFRRSTNRKPSADVPHVVAVSIVDTVRPPENLRRPTDEPEKATEMETVPEGPTLTEIQETTPEDAAATAEPAPVAKAVAMRTADQSIAAGRVLLINRKFNFLVTNLGSRQGLSLEDVLVIEKDGAQIGKVRVEKLYDDYCAAYIIEEQVEIPIEEGDLVTPE